MNIIKELKRQIKSYINFKKEQYAIWKQVRLLGRAIKLANATSKAHNGIQYHVFKVGNTYSVNRRLDFKASTKLSQKEKDRMNVVKLREGAIYSTPLVGRHETNLREDELYKAVVSLPAACLIFRAIKNEGTFLFYDSVLKKWNVEEYKYTDNDTRIRHKENMIYYIRLGTVKRNKKKKALNSAFFPIY